RKSGFGHAPKRNGLGISRVVRRVNTFALRNRSGGCALTKWCTTEIFSSMGGYPVGEHWTFGHNTGGVHVFVDDVVVVFDLLKIHRIAKTWGLEEITCIGPQRRKFNKFIAVAFEMSMVCRIKPDQRSEQAYIGFRDVLAH